MTKNKEAMVITGLIETLEGNIVFSAENFKFTFMKSDLSSQSITLKVDECGYIWGKTHDQKAIAIYIRQDIEVKNVRILNTWNYIISKYAYKSKSSISSFNIIRFQNGPIRTIYPCNALHEDFSKDNPNAITYHIEKDYKTYNTKLYGELVRWNFYSIINKRLSINEGNSLSNSVSVMDVVFDKAQSYDTFFRFYGYVCDLCAFLTFRNNISFEKVYLLQELADNRSQICAECFVKKAETISERDMVRSIPIYSIDEIAFENIFLNILKKDDKHKGLPTFIIPSNDLDAMTMDIGKIRNICSALEMELNLGAIHLNSNSSMTELIDQVKQVVKKHRNENKIISSKMYDNIFGSISHWEQPLAERIIIAWKLNESKIHPLLNRYDINVSETDIQQFVKARNNITHNGFCGLDENVCKTAFILIGLIYCCTLSRLGFTEEAIKDFMDKRLIG